MKQIDVAIVGAGFAGLACARTTASLGLRTIVLERKADPGDSPRTTGILVQEAALEARLPAALVRRIPGIRLYGPSLRHVDLGSPGYSFFATDTSGVLRHLAAEAGAAGARILAGCPYAGARREGRWIRLASPPIATRFLVGADGVRSRVARDFGLGRNREVLAGVEIEYEGAEGIDRGRLHCFLDSRLAPGYIGWAVPGPGIVQVGLAARRPSIPHLERFLERLAGVFDLRAARPVGRRAGRIPVGGPVRPIGAPGVVLVGDAGGLVSPLTAGGIHPALLSGRLVGAAIAAHLAGGPHPARILRRRLPRRPWKALLRRAIDLRPPNGLIDRLIGNRLFGCLAQAVFFHHHGLLGPGAWRDVLRRALA